MMRSVTLSKLMVASAARPTPTLVAVNERARPPATLAAGREASGHASPSAAAQPPALHS